MKAIFLNFEGKKYPYIETMGAMLSFKNETGMDASAMIISINTDENAPINKIADYAITGDVAVVIPKMIKYYKQNSK